MKDKRLIRPNPQFYRRTTQIINDGWLFSFDDISYQPINVPYCPQSELSGINFKSFIKKCFYKKNLIIKKNNKKVFIHFGAVDYLCSLYINNEFVGKHSGGYTHFSFEITNYLKDGNNEIYLVVEDELGSIASGKQSDREKSYGCFYTRTTGIWQDVWLEYTGENYIESILVKNDKYYEATLQITAHGEGTCHIRVSYEEEIVDEQESFISNEGVFNLVIKDKHLWSERCGNIYDVEISFDDDFVDSYFGIRTVYYDGFDFYLNNKKSYQKFVMDQGYNPRGIYSFTSEQMITDITNALSLGFNGVRMHQKVFEPKYLYLCDKYGLMSWGEFPSWGIDYSNFNGYKALFEEWGVALKEYSNHPSIVVLCPLNETWYTLDERKKKRLLEYVDDIYDFTKRSGVAIPVIDVSGGFHGHHTDIYDFHSYEKNESIKKYLERFDRENVLDVPLLYSPDEEDLRYDGKTPVVYSECGGLALLPYPSNNEVSSCSDEAVQSEEAWGYGKPLDNRDDFLKNYKELMSIIASCKKLSGFCYTQLYDVEQEQNGLFTYDRKPKLSKEEMNIIKNINERFGNE